ncbi:polysaccharide pyruvyl transferase family protein [Parasulfitobacter algicola]|uniref:Polysaccharide pyruvyl transferase family protein n=1 Tax=Parasulfitobacter algicola TaxID=2614809 RepID=A0ABX2IPT8_9RHOB|nr:polysaccharide pyruvyl transferase family protein [Sulfitobacter algicola]NSX54902.1 polysaccharide pyruvyl transferase family protein [Sulfitobacter algicola]
MKLTFFDNDIPNFGDEVNRTMWGHFTPPDFFDQDESELFIAIGSILYDDYPAAARKIVAGSGYAGYSNAPNVHDGTWEILFVRGPQTAEVLGIDPSLAVTDSAVLLRATPLPDPAPNIGAAFMPHFDSLQRGDWAKVCKMAGITFIDPRDPVDRIIAQIRGADVVVTEAMHGAIVSDAMRTPWVSVLPIHKAHRFKWLDWARSVEIDYQPKRLWPSSTREALTFFTGHHGIGARTKRVLDSAPTRPFTWAIEHIAAQKLQNLVKQTPQLSDDAVIERVTDRAVTAIETFVKSRRSGDKPIRAAE